MKKRIFSFFLALCMLCTLLPATALAATTSSGLEYEIVDNSYVKITGYSGSDTTLTIPDTIEGKPVKVIGQRAFEALDEHTTNLTSITIPNSVTEIGNRAFAGCTKLTSITIPKSVATMGDLVFAQCPSLTEITVDSGNTIVSSQDGVLFNKDKTTLIWYPEAKSTTSYSVPDGVKEIDTYAFLDCTNLTSITIPKSVDTIESNYAFPTCPNLTAITVDSGNTHYFSQDGVLFDNSKATLIAYPAGKTGKDYDIPNSVTTISQYAFRNCTGLTGVSIPNSVKTIRSYAFNYCTKLTSITIPDGVTIIDTEVFEGCTSLTSVSLPSTVTEIGDHAFADCSKLSSISIPQSVTRIDNHAFMGCSSLTSIRIPAGVTDIGKGPFMGCTGLTAITVDSGNTYYFSQDGVLFDNSKATLIAYPAGKTGEDYDIPNSVTKIDWYAFFDCSKLSGVSIPNSVNTIGDYAFMGCSKLSSISIPNGVTKIGWSVFKNCTSLTNVSLPDGLTTIYWYAFEGCSSLTSINLPDSVTSISDWAFAGCSSLTSISIPNGVTTIYYRTFADCSSLISVSIPNSITKIEKEAFAGCSKLWHVLYRGTETEWKSIGFYSGNTTLRNAIRHYNAKGDEVYKTDITTCTEKILYACTLCDAVLSEPISGGSHNFNIEVVGTRTPATCMATGSVTMQCANCDATEAQTLSIDSDNHTGVNYTENAKEATCGEAGYTGDTVCECGETIEPGETIPALGHRFENGTCTVCGEVDPDYEAPHTHSYTTKVTAPTCTETGYTTYTCACGDTYMDNEVAALGHTEETIVGYTATCTETGLTDGTHCDRCGKVLAAQEEIPALGHNEVTDKGKNATCTETGLTNGTHCDRCGKVLAAQEEIPALGHNEVTDKGKDATCTETGLTDGTHCDRCGKVLTVQTEIPAKGHNWDSGVVTREPTEEDAGIRTFTCTVCGETRTEKIAPLGHTHNYTTTVTKPTCTERGYTTYTCKCGDSYVGDYVDALGHTAVTDPGVDATCTKTGLTEGSHCSACNEVIVAQEVIPMTDHIPAAPVRENEIAPTCSVEGSYDEVVCCDVCDHEISRKTHTVEKTEHTYQDGVCTECNQADPDYEAPAKATVSRIAGADRIGTALSVAAALKDTLGIEKLDTIILAAGGSGQDQTKFADALSGSYLASSKKAPILLYTKGDLAEANLAFIEENLSENGTIYLLGGEVSIPGTVEAALIEAGYNVKRLGGDDRYHTNLIILDEAGIEDAEEVLIAGGQAFADSLSASATGLPIMLVKGSKTTLTNAQIEFLKSLEGKKVTILGGNAAVSAELEAAIEEVVGKDVERVFGETREATSAMIAKKYFPEATMALITYSKMYPDGLAGGVLANVLGAPLLLTNSGKEAIANEYVEATGIEGGYVLGGTAVVTDETARLVFGLDSDTVIVAK